jgi:multisubunit Na+/H+ antiporter MnhC subunit
VIAFAFTVVLATLAVVGSKDDDTEEEPEKTELDIENSSSDAGGDK